VRLRSSEDGAGNDGTGWAEGCLRRRRLLESRHVVALAVLCVEGRGGVASMDYDVRV